MPTINVSRVLSNPRFMQSFKVHRKTGNWVNGKWQQDEIVLTFKGVVVNANPKEVLQVPEGDRIGGMMAFYSKQEMFTTHNYEVTGTNGPGTSDELEWKGDRYRVVTVNTWGDYGYFKALAVYMEGD